MSAVPESSSEENPEHLLVLDDEKSIRWVLERTLTQSGYRVHLATDASEAHHLLNQYPIRLALVDINLPDQDGISFTQNVSTKFPKLMTIVMTGQGTMHNTIEAMKAGAFEFVTKPFDILQIEELVRQALKVRHAEKRDSSDLKSSSEELLVGQGPKMRELFKSIGRVASTELTVLIQGESGTGKELIAKTIHQHSNRAKGPFVAINCAAIPSELLESELFGHEKGSFTGAFSQRIGRFEQAENGSLFLDEIGDMPLDSQTRLLRVLSNKEFYRVGGDKPIKVDVRIIAATHQNLNNLVSQKNFREDLFYRLNVIKIEVPPLRDRKDDISDLSKYFLKNYADSLDEDLRVISDEAMKLMNKYDWPGNVRQLENVCYWLTLMSPSQSVKSQDLPTEIKEFEITDIPTSSWEDGMQNWLKNVSMNIDSGLSEIAITKIEKMLIKTALERSNGKKNDAAQILGWGRNTLSKKMKEHGI